MLQVASSSQPASVAGAIAGLLRDDKLCELQAIGAGAINQTVKAIAIARGYLAPSGIQIVSTPSFQDVIIRGEERTAMRFKVEKKPV
jgi:stage V sporulation protein S